MAIMLGTLCEAVSKAEQRIAALEARLAQFK